jgi:hypothetical protein
MSFKLQHNPHDHKVLTQTNQCHCHKELIVQLDITQIRQWCTAPQHRTEEWSPFWQYLDTQTFKLTVAPNTGSRSVCTPTFIEI